MGIALAFYCNAFGLKFYCVVDPNINRNNLKILQLLGAHIIMVDKADKYGGYLISRINEVRKFLEKNKDAYWINQYDNLMLIESYECIADEKPISAELAQLIRMAITYTREKYGETKYIFVNDKDSAKPLQYGTIQSRIVKMIHEKDIRDDNGNLFGFGSHLYRHYYSVKLSEMHLDDWTIAQLLGHRSVRNVKYYRKMSNQALADDTREVLKMLSDQMKESLDGWEEEYEQIRQNGGM